MHVVLDCRFAYPRLSGIGRYVLTLAEGLGTLRANRVDGGRFPRVTLLVRDEAQVLRHLRGEAAELFGRVVVPYSPRDVRSIGQLVRTLRDLGATVFHTPDVFAPLRTLQPVCPTVVTVHDLIPLVCLAARSAGGEGEGVGLKARFRGLWAAWVAVQTHLASAVLTCSQHSAGDLRRCFGISARVVYPGVSAGARPSQLQVTELQARLGLLGERYVLFVGRPEPYKNIEGLLYGLHRLGDRFADVKLVVAGEEDPRFLGARRVAGRLGLLGRLCHTGHVEDGDLAALYGGAQVLGLVSHYEGFGYPPLEALAAGTPVLASGVSSLPEVLGDAAVYASPESPEEIASGLERLLTSAELRAELVRRGVARLARFTPELQASQTLAVYREVVG